MTWIVPSFLALALFLLGQHHSGPVAGAFMAVVGLVVGRSLGHAIRGRSIRQAPTPPDALPGEKPILHGPVRLLQSQGPDCEVWAYLSNQRLSLQPSGAGEGVTLLLSQLEEIRPPARGSRNGRLSLVFAGQTWKLKAPDARRWVQALRSASRKNDVSA